MLSSIIDEFFRKLWHSLSLFYEKSDFWFMTLAVFV